MFRSILFKTGHTGIVFISTLVISKLLVPGDFGIIAILILNSTLLTIISGFGSESIIMYMVSNQKMKTSEATGYMFRVIGIQLGIFFILEAFSALVFQKTLLSWLDPRVYLIPEILYFMGLVVMEKILIFFYAHLKSFKINRLLFLLSAIYIVVLSLLFLKQDVTLPEIIWLLSLFSIIQGVVLLAYFARKFTLRVDWRKLSGINLYLRHSSFIIFANIIQLFAYRIDLWIIKSYHSDEDVGLFSLAGKFANLIWILPNLIVQLLVPYFSNMNKDETVKVFRVALWFNFLLTLGGLVVTWFFYSFFIDPSYERSLTAFYWMLPGYFCWAAVIYFAGYFAWKGEFKINFYASAGCLVLILITDMLLIPSLSYMGAAIANSIVYCLVMIYYIILFAQRRLMKPLVLLKFGGADIHFVKTLLQK
jgi:O-antigen/teichoic acid export membrane protein